MINYLRGVVTDIENDYIIIEIVGVGYQVYCANPTGFYTFQNQEIKIYIHDHIREDTHLLYGFISKEEQHLFKQLIEVSGIGPKVALSALSGSSPELLMQAIISEDVNYLTTLSGIGRKTAQRIVIDLKDKLHANSILNPKSSQVSQDLTEQQIPMNTLWKDAKQALLEWGYTDHELQKAWLQIKELPQEQQSVENLMKTALKILGKS
jgi:Holliday junction DNA helicase RuvA